MEGPAYRCMHVYVRPILKQYLVKALHFKPYVYSSNNQECGIS
jgi:hypothetical protein